ncbi:cache domain-containing protein [Serratia microhaemolytica]|uniref:cache domain-containing protein n=1 Tax=Serratia microhaemolytica TaxID=2675110 RepID=UPI000FDEC0D7|nr:cache domain-containing protein [Serratia microhaemolytica]
MEKQIKPAIVRAEHLLADILADAQNAAKTLAEATAAILSDVPSEHFYAGGVRLNPYHRRKLQPQIHATLQQNLWCNGAGFASHALIEESDEEYWTLEWWRQEGPSIQPAQLEQNQAQRKRLDFRLFDWFEQPAYCHRPFIDGPYVDYVCNSAYTITIAHPVLVEGNFAGVVALDVLVSTLDRLLQPTLGAIKQPAIVINDQARVVSSTTPALRSGALWRETGNVHFISQQSTSLRLVVLPVAS